MIEGWLAAGQLNEAMAVVEAMRARGVAPNTATVVTLLRGALHLAQHPPDASAAAGGATTPDSKQWPTNPVDSVLDQLLQVRAPALLRGSIWTDSFFTPEESEALKAAIHEWAHYPGRSALDRDAVLQGAPTSYPFELPFENAVRPLRPSAWAAASVLRN